MYWIHKATPLLLLAASNLIAIPPNPCELPKTACCSDSNPGPFAFSYPHDLDLTCPSDFYFHVDALAFQPKEDGMAWAIYNNQTDFSPLYNAKIVGWSDNKKDWKYDWGMRIGAGFYLDPDAWNLDFNWTWLKLSDYKKSSAPGTGLFIPLWALGKDTVAEVMLSNNISAVWNGSYTTFDLSLGKPYFVSRYLILSPHFGGRGGWINQHFSVDYSGFVAANSSPNRYIHHANQDFWGVGIRAGLDSDWFLGKGFWLFGQTAASLLYGKFEIDQNLTTPVSVSVRIPGQGFNLDDDIYKNIPNFEIILGLGWSHSFDKRKYQVGLRAAYEFHYWWNQLNLRRFWTANPSYANDVIARGDLSLSGFSLSFQLDM